MSENKLVLVVEDNDFVRAQLVSFIKEAGYAVLEAADGEAALAQVGAHDDIALAIVDVRMEPMGGFEFLQILQGEQIEAPTILVTGDQTPDMLERASKAGVGAVLMKPVQKERLIKTIERVLKSESRKR